MATSTSHHRRGEELLYAEDATASRNSSVRMRSLSPVTELRAKLRLVGRRTLGLGLLMVTVILWTGSNLLTSLIFSDHTYDKPFFLLYANTSVFAISLLPMFTKYMLRSGLHGLRSDLEQTWTEYKQSGPSFKSLAQDDDEELLADTSKPQEKLNLCETAVLSFEFCMLWFLANYFASASLEYTSVASATILTSTSSVWTLIFCAIFGVEPYSRRNMIGVLASLVGIVLISTVDLTGSGNEDRGTFPEKTITQTAIGDLMAFLSAVIYGMYVTVMKRRVGNEERVDMKLFFGLVGFIILVTMWPLFFILHWTKIEPFEMPPKGWIWTVIILNSVGSYVSDIAWAFAMLLTSPIVTTVGLSLTIPLSLIGEMIQYGQYSSFLYWLGGAIVLVSFLFVNNERRDDTEPEAV